MYRGKMKSSLAEEIAGQLQIPPQELMESGAIAYLERELRLAERDIADLRDRYGVLSPQQLEQLITVGKIYSHPAWEDLIVWENTLHHIDKLKELLERIQTGVA